MLQLYVPTVLAPSTPLGVTGTGGDKPRRYAIESATLLTSSRQLDSNRVKVVRFLVDNIKRVRILNLPTHRYIGCVSDKGCLVVIDESKPNVESSGRLIGRLISHPTGTAGVVLILGLIVTLILHTSVSRLEQRRVQDNFNLTVLKHLNLLERTIATSIAPLETLRAFYRSSDSVYREEFRSFVEPLLATHPEIEALQWIPRLARDKQQVYEKTARDEGIADFEVRSWSAGGPSRESEDLFPIYVTEPYTENRDLLGLDIASHPGLVESISWSCDQNTVAATPMLRVNHHPDAAPVMFVLMPVYQTGHQLTTVKERRKFLKGYVAARYQTDRIISQTLTPQNREQFHLVVSDMMAPSGQPPLYLTQEIGSENTHLFAIDDGINHSNDVSHSAVLNLADRLWSVRYLPTDSFLRRQESGMDITALAAGVAISILLVIGAMLGLHHAARIREVSRQLQTAKEKLEQDMLMLRKMEHDLRLTQFTVDKAADAIYWMRADARLVYVNEAACRVLDYTKEELLNLTVHDVDPNMPADLWSKHWEDLKQFRSFTMDSTHRTKSGRIFPVELTVNLLEFEDQMYNCVYARDISDRQNSQVSTDTSLCSFQNFADNIDQGIVVISPRKTVLYMNRQLKQQYPEADLSLSPQCYDLFNGGVGNGICPGCPAEATVEQGATCQRNVQRVTHDGRKQFNITTSPIRDKDGEIVAFVETMSVCLDHSHATPITETFAKGNANI